MQIESSQLRSSPQLPFPIACRALAPAPKRRARALEAHGAAFRRELFSIPGGALGLVARWRALRCEGADTAVLAAGFGDASGRDWTLHVDIHLNRLAHRVLQRAHLADARDASSRQRRAHLDEEIERLASGMGVALDVAIGIYCDLRALRDAPRGRRTSEQRRRAGLHTAAGRACLARAGRALERLDGVRRGLAGDHLDLVADLAGRFRDRGVPYLDLVLAGNVALLRAVETFDYRGGVPFEEHAAEWVEQALSRAVRGAPRAA